MTPSVGVSLVSLSLRQSAAMENVVGGEGVPDSSLRLLYQSDISAAFIVTRKLQATS